MKIFKDTIVFISEKKLYQFKINLKLSFQEIQYIKKGFLEQGNVSSE